MERPEINNQLSKDDLFRLFQLQLKKDFEGAGLNSDFISLLPSEFESLRNFLLKALEKDFRSGAVTGLLYRVDVSEAQLSDYLRTHPKLSFEETVAELIIKRTLQKVILKKRFS